MRTKREKQQFVLFRLKKVQKASALCQFTGGRYAHMAGEEIEHLSVHTLNLDAAPACDQWKFRGTGANPQLCH
jgi:hypothetical protein